MILPHPEEEEVQMVEVEELMRKILALARTQRTWAHID
jgi:hypothetical protein